MLCLCNNNAKRLTDKIKLLIIFGPRITTNYPSKIRAVSIWLDMIDTFSIPLLISSLGCNIYIPQCILGKSILDLGHDI